MKRVFDVVLSSVAILLMLPIMAVLAVVIVVDSSGGVFYRGMRVGLHGRSFRIMKFRTMVCDAEKRGGPSTSDRDVRITRCGRYLRKYKLDELPQLFNVLIGDMSLVGPRPEVRRYTDLYTQEERKILTVRPGITDWASLANPDEGAILAQYDDPDRAYEEIIRPEKLRLQLEYVRRNSMWNDVLIIMKTVGAVLGRPAS